MRKELFLLVGLFFLCHTIQGGTYYVDQSNSDSSDQNPGTEKRPWKTIQKAARIVKAGDTVLIKKGTYRECIAPVQSGGKDKLITFKAYPGHTVVVKGSILVKGWKKYKDGIWVLDNWKNPFPENKYATEDVWQIVEKDAVLKGAVVLRRVEKTENLAPGTFSCDSKNKKLYVFLNNNTTNPNEKGLEVSVFGILFEGRGRSGISVEGLQFRHCSSKTTNGLNTRKAFRLEGSNNRMKNVTISWSDGGAATVCGHNCVIDNCTFAYCGRTGVMLGTGNLIMKDSRVIYTNLERHDPSGYGGGLKAHVISKCTFLNNEFAYNVGPGLWFDMDCTGNIVDGNRCHDNEGSGIMIEVSLDNIIRNNICYKNTDKTSGMHISHRKFKADNGTMRTEWNHFYKASRPYGGMGIYNSSSEGTKIYNNVCYDNQWVGIRVYGGPRGENGKNINKDVKIFNNICYNNGASQLDLYKLDKSVNESDHNILFSGRGVPLVRRGNQQYSDLASWQKASGQDLNSLDQEPDFINAAACDFRVYPFGGAVDAGKALKDVPADITGKKRPEGGAYDIGAHETDKSYAKSWEKDKPAAPEKQEFTSVDLKDIFNSELTVKDKNSNTLIDLSTVPVGIKAGSVPFKINRKAVCLHYAPSEKTFKKKVTIPINLHADTIHFLHTSVNPKGKEVGRYIIHYDDKTSAKVKLIPSWNIRDWRDAQAEKPFLIEYPTTTTLAWTGKTEFSPTGKANIWSLQWVNKNPWIKISHVEFQNSAFGTKGMPVLLAVTVGKELDATKKKAH